ncbi:MAG: DUF5063 domain-containing protein [Verrucomicrobiota bacterium JB024]|nr:DUF5063 domain-containing protein [Verrucomicrobiota bacterium JB024]
MSEPSVEQFRQAAEAFCALVESDGPFGAAELLCFRDLLLRLLLHVPAVEVAQDFEVDYDCARPGVGAHAKLVKKLGGLPIDRYRKVFDPHDAEAADEPVVSLLSDDLVDIYGDLRGGLELARAGQLGAACAEWAQMYRVHWHRHALGALTAIETWRETHDTGED